MSASPAKATAYAIAATFVPWAVGALLSFVLIYAGGYPDDEGESSWETFSGDWLSDWALAFPVLAALFVGVLAWARPTPHRWLLATRNTVGYAGVLLVVSAVRFLSDGAGEAVDYAFVTLLIALFTLQLPLCAALSAALAGPLRIVTDTDDADPGADVAGEPAAR
ncbi:hypothetical protein AB0F42_29350 [Streptomyces buecherae]|uniref:hypothetical protein n=1 Tax=Streptomyces buecherae TaxID=2763006 RepID=UPI00340BC8A5